MKEIDNRGSHFYLALYWAEALAAQDQDASLREKFSAVRKSRSPTESLVSPRKLLEAQGEAVDIGGYYWPNREAAAKAMRPSQTLKRDYRQHVLILTGEKEHEKGLHDLT